MMNTITLTQDGQKTWALSHNRLSYKGNPIASLEGDDFDRLARCALDYIRLGISPDVINGHFPTLETARLMLKALERSDGRKFDYFRGWDNNLPTVSIHPGVVCHLEGPLQEWTVFKVAVDGADPLGVDSQALLKFFRNDGLHEKLGHAIEASKGRTFEATTKKLTPKQEHEQEKLRKAIVANRA